MGAKHARLHAFVLSAVLASSVLFRPCAVYADVSELAPVSYMETKDQSSFVESYELLEKTSDPLPSGWYVVRGNVWFDAPLEVEGDIHVILSDNCMLVAQSGLLLRGDAQIKLYARSETAGRLVVLGGISRVSRTSDGVDVPLESDFVSSADQGDQFEAIDAATQLEVLTSDKVADALDAWSVTSIEKDDKLHSYQLSKEFISLRPAMVDEPSTLTTLDVPKPPVTQDQEEVVSPNEPYEDDEILLTYDVVDDGYCYQDDEPGQDDTDDAQIEPIHVPLEQTDALDESSNGMGAFEELLNPWKRSAGVLALASLLESYAGVSWAAGSGDVPSDSTGQQIALVAASERETTVTVSFDANGGYGTMSPLNVVPGETFALPECIFDPPAGKVFDSWSLGKPGSHVSVPSSTTVRAWWKTAPSGGDNTTDGSSSTDGNSGAASQEDQSSSSQTSTTQGSQSELSIQGDQSSVQTTNVSATNETSTSQAQRTTNGGGTSPKTGDASAPVWLPASLVVLGSELLLWAKARRRTNVNS